MKQIKYYCNHCEREMLEDEVIINIWTESENGFKFINHKKQKIMNRCDDLHFCSEVHFVQYFTTIKIGAKYPKTFYETDFNLKFRLINENNNKIH